MENGIITRRMQNVLSGLDEEFNSLYSVDDFERKIKALKNCRKSERHSILSELYGMFELCGIKYEAGKSDGYYKTLVDGSALPQFDELEGRMLAALYKRYRSYPTPEEYMRRIVDRLSPGGSGDTLRLCILKGFIADGGWLQEAGYNGRGYIQKYVKRNFKAGGGVENVLEHLDDGVFDCLENATRDQRKPDGTYGLLKLADDLASGKFRTEGATKRGLYLFAMVFGMTYYDGSPGSIRSYESDIEINLFRDYYANNLMRFIGEDYKGEKSAAYERDPSGQGINYKSFPEMVYLYYLVRDIPPAEKISQSSAMIKRIVEKGLKSGDGAAGAWGGRRRNTAEYKKLFCEDILKYTEEKFEQFLCDNYNCDTYAGRQGAGAARYGVFSLETEQNTAYQKYLELIDGIWELCQSERPDGMRLCRGEINYGLWFTDLAMLKERLKAGLADGGPDIGGAAKSMEDFVTLLENTDRFLRIGFRPEEVERERQAALQRRKIRAGLKKQGKGGPEPGDGYGFEEDITSAFIDSPGNITRTAILAAYYYRFNLENTMGNMARRGSFREVFEKFKAGADEVLEACSYQPISGKNIFDVLVIFSSYAYLNL